MAARPTEAGDSQPIRAIRPDRRLRSLRLLPAALPDLPLVGRGDGLPARAHRSDAGLRDGQLALTPVVAQHFDRCLGCLACVTACPSGVRYDMLIEPTRADSRAGAAAQPGDRLHRALVFALFPVPGPAARALVLLWLYVRSGLQRLLRAGGVLLDCRRAGRSWTR